jgi:hypothetical protein
MRRGSGHENNKWGIKQQEVYVVVYIYLINLTRIFC